MSAGKELVILVVPDPTRPRKIEDVRGGKLPDWALTSIPEAKAKALLKTTDVRGLIHKARPSEYEEDMEAGHMAVYINDTLLLWHQIGETPEARMQPVFMNFDTFQNILGNDEILHDLANKFSAVWGGLDLTIGGSGQVKLTGEGLESYVKGLQKLEKMITVWPPVDETVQLRELDTIAMLDEISKVEARTARPWTSLTLPKPSNMQLVLKREGTRSPGKNENVKLTWNQDRIWNILQKSTPSNRWYCQEWVPEWTEVGQWRCIVVGGREVNHVVLDSPEGPMLREDGRTLSGMYRLQNSRDSIFPEGGTIYDIKAADAELKDFVKLNLSKLIQMEEKKFGSRSSLRLWSRIDLSIIPNHKVKKYDYFVTGVERGLRMALYGNVYPTGVRMFACGFAEEFHSYLLQKGARN